MRELRNFWGNTHPRAVCELLSLLETHGYSIEGPWDQTKDQLVYQVLNRRKETRYVVIERTFPPRRGEEVPPSRMFDPFSGPPHVRGTFYLRADETFSVAPAFGFWKMGQVVPCIDHVGPHQNNFVQELKDFWCDSHPRAALELLFFLKKHLYSIGPRFDRNDNTLTFEAVDVRRQVKFIVIEKNFPSERAASAYDPLRGEHCARWFEHSGAAVPHEIFYWQDGAFTADPASGAGKIATVISRCSSLPNAHNPHNQLVVKHREMSQKMSPSDLRTWTLRVARRLAKIFEPMHAKGLVYGNFSRDSVVIAPGGNPVVIGWDSAQWTSGAVGERSKDVQALGDLIYQMRFGWPESPPQSRAQCLERCREGDAFLFPLLEGMWQEDPKMCFTMKTVRLMLEGLLQQNLFMPIKPSE